MGLLDMALGSVLGGGRGRGGRSPVVNALLLALAAKAVQHYLSQRRQGQPAGQAGAGGGLGDVLGGMLGGAGGTPGGMGGFGSVLGGLGGAGALGGLLEQFNRRGLADKTQSWVDTGPNQALAPEDLAQALDDDDVDQLARETGLPREAVLTEVAAALPGAIDHLTPDGRLPSEQELGRMAADYEAQSAAR